MRTRRLHVTGASGAGVTSLGRALAESLALPHHDADDYYWRPTNPPYRAKREVADRLRLMREVFLDRSGWVLSGALGDWADPIILLFDLVVFVYAPTEIRLQRLRKREARQFGADAVAPGGWRHQEAEEFIEWASQYEDGSREGHQRAWLAHLPCRMIEVDGAQPMDELLRQVTAAIEA